jgi:hypothetical protein
MSKKRSGVTVLVFTIQTFDMTRSDIQSPEIAIGEQQKRSP